MTSTNGTNWTIRSLPIENTVMYTMCWSNELGKFCSVGIGSMALLSSNGINWIQYSLSTSNTWGSICWSLYLRKFCAVSANNTSVAILSSDGMTWTVQTLPDNASYNKIIWISKFRLFCTLWFKSSPNAWGISISPDGVTWTSKILELQSSPVPINLCWSDELETLVILHNNSLIISYNLVDFERRNLGDKSVYGGYNSCWSPELMRFCLCGSNTKEILLASIE